MIPDPADSPGKGADRRDWLVRAAVGLSILSLLINLVFFTQLLSPDRWIDRGIVRMTERLGGEDGTLRYEVRVPAGTPIRADIPVDESFTVGVDTVIPINTTVRVPFRSPFGTHSVDLPIRTDVPLRTRLPIRIRHVFQLSTETDQEIVVPLEIRLDDLLPEQAGDSSPGAIPGDVR